MKKDVEAHHVNPGGHPTTLTCGHLITCKDSCLFYKQMANIEVRINSKDTMITKHRNFTNPITHTCNFAERACIELINSSCCSITSAIESSSLAENVAFSVDMECALCLIFRDKETTSSKENKTGGRETQLTCHKYLQIEMCRSE